MRSLSIAVLFLVAMPVHAALVNNGSFTTDTASGLDWLDLDTTFGQSMTEATTANSGWRLATEAEVTTLFWTLFPNFYETADGTCSEFTVYCGTSKSAAGSPDQNAKVVDFVSLFGFTDAPSQPNTQVSRGRWLDDLGGVHTMGAVAFSPTNSTIYGIDYLYSASADAQIPNVGTYLVRTSVVPVPAAVWLFGSALSFLGFARRKTVAP